MREGSEPKASSFLQEQLPSPPPLFSTAVGIGMLDDDMNSYLSVGKGSKDRAHAAPNVAKQTSPGLPTGNLNRFGASCDLICCEPGC